ncbi:uncharacterized protein [Rutidosis leptorrhynchoides]|uniref:uncharacterized protein n=1 Tax=Rutidosis leptorrhynchoides TaxID=125765 RepID=UPI003A99FA26
MVTSSSVSGDNIIEITFGHQLYLHPTDSSLSIQVDELLTGVEIYGDWSRNVYSFVLTKHKIGFLNGTCRKEDFHSRNHDQWDCANALVLSWLFCSVHKDLARTIRYFTNASAACIIDLKIPDPASLAIIHAYFEDVNFYEFLMGLNDSYLAIRGQINLMNLPPLTECYNLLIQEEAQRGHSSQSTISTLTIDAMYYAASSSSSVPKKKFQSNCDHCGIRGHKRSECYKLHDFPKDFKFTKGKTQAHNAAQDSKIIVKPVSTSTADVFSPAPTFTPAQYAQIMRLLSTADPSAAMTNAAPFAASSHIADPSSQHTRPSTSNSGILSHRTWIIDSGTTNHMTYNVIGMHSVSSLSQLVHLPNGNHASITHTGNLSISTNLSLKNVLLIPSFKNNLLSVHKITKDSNCFVSFYPDFCLMQDISTGMV